MVVAKFGSLPNAAASSFSVSSAAGDEPTRAASAVLTNAVVATCVLFTVCAAVGAVGVQVSAGLASGAFRASALLSVVTRFHPAQPVVPVHFGYSSGADKIGDKAHDFCELCVHSLIVNQELEITNNPCLYEERYNVSLSDHQKNQKIRDLDEIQKTS